jgi:YidC/Oxa1 family membrane protein insertase
MNSETRFVLAVVLMLGVLVGTSLLFPPAPPPEPDPAGAVDTVEAPVPGDTPVVAPDPVAGDTGAPAGDPPRIPGDPPELPPLESEAPDPLAGLSLAEEAEDAQARAMASDVIVEGPLYTYTFSTLGARLASAELNRWNSFTRPGPVELVNDASHGPLASRLVVGADTVDLRNLLFEVEPAGGLRLEEGGSPQALTFRYEHPDRPFSFEVRYTFSPDGYVIEAQGRVRGLERGLLVTDLGRGLAYNEVDTRDEARVMAYATNHLQNGISSHELSGIEGATVAEGPFYWAAVRSRYFVLVVLRGHAVALDRRHLRVPGLRGTAGLRLLAALGNDLQEVNPVGWSFLRPLLRPFVAAIMWVLVFLHENLALGYGWVLILFGVLMRIVLFPLYHKAMRAQLRNMAVQPLLKEIQTKYKDKPGEDAEGADEALQGARLQPARRVLADAAPLADPDRALLRLPEHDRAAGRALCLAPGPGGQGPALHSAGAARGLDVPPPVDLDPHHGGGEPADEDDDVAPAHRHGRDLRQLPVGAEPLLPDREPRDAARSPGGSRTSGRRCRRRASYTGEDVAEIERARGAHGGGPGARGVPEAAGARLAEPGEFTRRAWLEGRLDQLQAEAIQDLIEAESPARHAVAVYQAEGGLSRRIEALREGCSRWRRSSRITWISRTRTSPTRWMRS